MKKIQTIIKTILSLSLVFSLSACSVLDITPEHVVPGEEAFKDVESYEAALSMLYRDLTNVVSNMQTTDYATDDFNTVIPGFNPTSYNIYNWDYQTQAQPYIWDYQYRLIARANVLMDNYKYVVPETKKEEDRRDQALASALAIRAWAHFNVAQLYAPHYDQTNGQELGIVLKLKLEEELLPLSSLENVYNQIFSDLESAEKLFSKSTTTSEYVFGLNATRALRARVALFIGDLELAKQASEHFISTSLLSKDNYWMLWEDQFGSLNNEVIFMTHDLSDTDDAILIDYHEMYVSNAVSLSPDFLASFDVEDVRKEASYIGPNSIPYKHIIPVNDRNEKIDKNLHYKHFRLAEQYLIYAEAVLASDPNETKRVINLLRTARGASLYESTPTKAQLLGERRRELFVEGLRFYDLKRLSEELNIIVERKNGKILAPNSPQYIWDIPLSETNPNPNID